MKIQIMGWKTTENLGCKSLLWKVKIFLSFFHFQILYKKVNTFVLTIFGYRFLQIRISIKTKIFNMFYLISNQLNKISKSGWNKRYPILSEEFENEKKKEQKIFDLPKRGFEPQIFSNFPAHDLNFHGKWGARDQFKTSF